MHMLTSVAQWKRLCALGIEEWLEKQRASGSIGRVGFSFHGSRSDFLELLEVFDWDIVQIQYNYADENNQAGRAGLLRAFEKGIPVVAMEPLLGGRLAGELSKSVHEIFSQAGEDGAEYPYSAAQWALRWLFDQEQVTCVLSGMTETSQIDENAHLASECAPGCVTEAERLIYQKALDAFEASFLVRCTGCNYCMPCPWGVHIPECFSVYNRKASLRRGIGVPQYVTATAAVAAKPGYASLCRNCGACAEKCPQAIPIAERLAEVKRVLEPFWFHPVMSLARRFMGGGYSSK